MPETTQPNANTNNNFKDFLVLSAFLELPINGTTLVGLPKYAVNVTGEGGGLRWGSSPEWAAPFKDKPRIQWVDDPTNPLSTRAVTAPQDIIGIKGGDMSIESILEIGQNQVVYCFYLHTAKMRVAYGFDRFALDQEHAAARRQSLLAKLAGA